MTDRCFHGLRESAQIEQLLKYIVEEGLEDAKKRFPFVACEIFTCEVDIILKALVDDEELMDFLFSFIESEHSHSTLLAGYFSKFYKKDYFITLWRTQDQNLFWLIHCSYA